MSDIENAVYWWLLENCTKHIENFVSLEALLTHFFFLSDSLYYALKEEPIEVIGGGHVMTDRPIEPNDKALERAELELFGNRVACNKNLIIIVNPLSDKAFFRLRGRLAVVGDLLHVVEALRKLGHRLDNKNLSRVLDSRWDGLEKYRYARNFFAHLDERIGKNINEHGVTGELEVPEISVKFSKDAEGCMYFGFDGNGTMYFHDKHDRYSKGAKACPKSVSFDKWGMGDVFSLVMDLYDLVASHTIYAHDYPPSGTVYDLS